MTKKRNSKKSLRVVKENNYRLFKPVGVAHITAPIRTFKNLFNKEDIMDSIGKKFIERDMLDASMHHQRNRVLAFVQEGLYINSVDESTGVTPLHCAAMFGDRELVDKLLEKGADIRAIDKKGRAPGDIAINAGEYEMSEYLTRLECQEIGRRKRRAAGLEP